MIVTVLPEVVLLFLLSFARIGTMSMLLPTLGEQNIPTRVRLGLALVISFVLYPTLVGRYPGNLLPDMHLILLILLGEIAIGGFVGLAARIVISSLSVAGTIISYQSSMALAQSFDPTAGAQGALVGNFLSVVGVTLLFATDLHHLAIIAMVDSYMLFPPGEWLPVGDVVKFAVDNVAAAFKLGINIAAPFLVFGIVFNLGLGLLNRLMPQVQIFFMAMPANVGIAFLILMATIGTMMTWYLDHVRQSLGLFIAQ